MTRQEVKTQEAIFTAFFDLLAQKLFHDIRIGGLCQRVNISRPAFYSHFTSEDDLLITVYRQSFQHASVTSPLAEHQTNQSLHKGSLEEQITHLYQHLKENADKVTTPYQLEDDYFSRSLQAELQKYLIPILKSIYFKESALPDQLLDQYIIDTFSTTLSWWLCAQSDLEAIEITHYYLKLLA